MTEPTPSGPVMLTAGQACWSIMARQAGMKPIITLVLPGPGASGAPWVVGSAIRAAGGIGVLRGEVQSRFKVSAEQKLSCTNEPTHGHLA